MTKKCRVGCVVGTRPELIKMAPVYFEFAHAAWADVTLINTGQHRDLIDDMLSVFDIRPDIDLAIMAPDQTLGQLTGHLCCQLDDLFSLQNFDVLLAAGDTSTVLTTALIAFYHKIPFGHIEAGLRTYSRFHPFPEEINRVVTAPLSTWHFAPTDKEKANLIAEGIQTDSIYVTGNSVIDALHWIIKHKPAPGRFDKLTDIITVTTHRRENFGEKLSQICLALLTLARQFPDINLVLPVHPNPRVSNEVRSILSGNANIHLIEPLAYDQFVSLMNASLLIMTDSGGIQEEAPALGKPVIVLRDSTERDLIIQENLGILAGTDTQSIVEHTSRLITDKALYQQMSRGVSPYGHGDTAKKIVDIVGKEFGYPLTDCYQ